MDQFFFLLAVVMFPGIIAAMISDKIVTHRPWSSFRFSLYSFVFGIACYLCVQLIVWIPALYSKFCGDDYLWKSLGVWRNVDGNGIELELWEVGLATAFAPPLSFLASSIIHHKTFNKLAQRLGVSSKFGDENLYTYYLNAQEIDWIYVRDRESDLTYEGRIVSYSENSQIQEMVISNVNVYRYSDSELLYSVPTAYIAKPIGNFVVEAVPSEFLES